MNDQVLRKGDQVVMHTCMEHESPENFGKIWTCNSNEFKLHPNHDYAVVMLEGYSGAFCTEFLQKVNVDKVVNQQHQEIERYKKVLQEIVGFSKYEGNQWYEDVKQALEGER
ncbi:hypothetical protein [Bacillus sp. Hm123]|uniref:hypothetical protein n=1 Tax=Bacillus sp. Hm123 TaxID=3450745 RepID=UPI003F424FCC